MSTINIKGKEYTPVVERVKEFHNLYPSGTITTEIISNDDKRVIVKATVKFTNKISFKEFSTNNFTTINEYEKIFTGFSQAEWGKGMMGSVALEVAETSAIGRALGFANIGLIDGIASADEVRKVSKPTTREEIESEPPF
jgi:hypothetical protein